MARVVIRRNLDAGAVLPKPPKKKGERERRIRKKTLVVDLGEFEEKEADRWIEIIWEALDEPEQISDWEDEFLYSIAIQIREGRRLTDKQEQVLERIVRKVRTQGGQRRWAGG